MQVVIGLEYSINNVSQYKVYGLAEIRSTKSLNLTAASLVLDISFKDLLSRAKGITGGIWDGHYSGWHPTNTLHVFDKQLSSAKVDLTCLRVGAQQSEGFVKRGKVNREKVVHHLDVTLVRAHFPRIRLHTYTVNQESASTSKEST